MATAGHATKFIRECPLFHRSADGLFPRQSFGVSISELTLDD